MMVPAEQRKLNKQVSECLSGIAAGDRSALESLYLLVSDAVYALALSVLKNREQAQDVLQDCFLRIWHTAENYTEQGRPMAWIMTVARNLCLMQLRQQTRTVLLHPEENEHLFGVQTDHADSLGQRILLRSCLHQLDEEEREIVVLHAVSGMKHREIAGMLQLPLATVLSKYHRALKKLKRILEKEAV